MKKILLVVSVFLIFGCAIFFCINDNKKENFTESYYLISSNTNNVFDPTFDMQSNMQFSMPFYSPALPISSSDSLDSINTIEEIYPFYSLFILDEFQNENTVIKFGNKKSTEQELLLPIPIEASNGEIAYIKSFLLKPIINYNHFYSTFDDNAFVKKFNSDSGVYISSMLYDFLQLNSNDDKLFLKLPIQIPIIAQNVEVDHGFFVSNEYTITGYQLVEYTFEVEGVIDSGYGNSFYRGNEILIPYEMSELIYSEVDLSKVTLTDNQTIWKPNCYIVKCNSETTIYQLGDAIEKEIGSCFIKYYDHGMNIDPLHYLFKEGNVLNN